jgi:hypothetical protein
MKASPLLPWFAARGYRIDVRAAWQLALGAAPDRAPDKSENAGVLTDASACARVLVLGARAAGALADRGLPVPEIFTWARSVDGTEVARVGAARFLVSAAPGGHDALPIAPTDSGECLLVVEHSCAAMRLTGQAGAAVLAEFCVLPPAMLTPRAWLLTQFAQVDVALSVDGGTTRILCAAAEGPALLATLAEAFVEHGGAVIGSDVGDTEQ